MIVSLTGPSGIGKGYVRRKLLEQLPFLKELVWITTRALRPDENQSTNRRSISTEEFYRLQEQGELILVQELFGYLYGLEKGDLFTANEQHIYLTEFHIDNLVKVIDLGLQIVAIALIPSDISLLSERLKRYRESKDPEKIKKRLDSTETEIRMINRYRSLFLTVIKVSKDTDGNTVVSRVLQSLGPILAKAKGGKL